MLCKKCGAEIPDDAQVCEYCGTPVTDVQEIYDENEKKRRDQINRNTEEKRIQLSEIQQRRDEKRAKQKRNKIIAIASLCVIGAGAVSVGGYFIYDNMKTTKTVVVTPAPSFTTAPGQSAAPSVSPGTSPSSSPDTSWSATGETGTGTSPEDQTSSGGGTSSSGTGSSGASAGSGTSSGGSGSSSSGSGTSGGGTSSSGGGTSSSGSGSSGSASGGTSSSSASSGGHSYNTSAKDSGLSTSNISSQITVGGEVINENNRWYMTFTSGDTKYYAHVNPGATTAQVAGKVYTMTAVPTNETYNGNTVYEITSMTKYDGTDYIIPDSGTRLLTSADIAGLSKSDLALARNEIYARHGRAFSTEIYKEYFSSKSWYKINPNYNYDDDNANLNSIEIQNVDFILKAEQ